MQYYMDDSMSDIHKFCDEDSNDVFDSIYPYTRETGALGTAITAGTEAAETTVTETEPIDVEGNDGFNTQIVITAGSSIGKKETVKRGKCPKIYRPMHL